MLLYDSQHRMRISCKAVFSHHKEATILWEVFIATFFFFSVLLAPIYTCFSPHGGKGRRLEGVYQFLCTIRVLMACGKNLCLNVCPSSSGSIEAIRGQQLIQVVGGFRCFLMNK